MAKQIIERDYLKELLPYLPQKKLLTMQCLHSKLYIELVPKLLASLPAQLGIYITKVEQMLEREPRGDLGAWSKAVNREALKAWKNQRRLTVADFRHYLQIVKPNALLFDEDRTEFLETDSRRQGMFDKLYGSPCGIVRFLF